MEMTGMILRMEKFDILFIFQCHWIVVFLSVICFSGSKLHDQQRSSKILSRGDNVSL